MVVPLTNKLLYQIFPESDKSGILTLFRPLISHVNIFIKKYEKREGSIKLVLPVQNKARSKGGKRENVRTQERIG